MAMISPLLKICLLLLAGQHTLGQEVQAQERTVYNSGVSGASGDSGGTGSSSKGSGKGSSGKGSSGKGSKKSSGKGGKGGSSTEDPLLFDGIFERTVFVDFEGLDTDPNDFSLVGPSALEIGFLNTYNALSAEFCDTAGIEILTALIQTDASGEYIIQRGGNKYSLEFMVLATCDNCETNTTTLFDHSLDQSISDFFTRRNLIWGLTSVAANGDTSSSSSSSKSGSSKGSKKSSKRSGSSSDSRVCTSTNPLFRAPTEEEFLEGYSSALRINSVDDGSSGRRLGCDFMSGGSIAVDQVIRVYEMSDESCSDVVEEFDVAVTATLLGDFEAVTDAERSEIEDAFVQNYNALQATRCDSPLFRSLQSAEIRMVATDEDTTGSFMYIFDVKGTCRGTGCSDNPTLFDEGDERLRRLQNSNSTEEAGATCSCPVSAQEDTAPQSEEMKILFDETIAELRDCSAVENIAGVTDVTELGNGFTVGPTSSPSNVPSSAPSISNMPSASAAPTGESPTVSEVPTVASAEPSSPPSISSAPSTSIEPSSVPSISSQPSISVGPSIVPTAGVVPSLSNQPSADPTPQASSTPSQGPSLSSAPSQGPSVSSAPSGSDDTFVPSVAPSNSPSIAPSVVPSTVPSQTPSAVVSAAPSTSAEPSQVPSISPSESPSESVIPSTVPSLVPSKSNEPSASVAPSQVPSEPVAAADDGGATSAGAIEDDDDVADDDDDDEWNDDEWDDDEWDDDEWDDDEWDDDEWDDDEWDDDEWDDDEWDDDDAADDDDGRRLEKDDFQNFVQSQQRQAKSFWHRFL